MVILKPAPLKRKSQKHSKASTLTEKQKINNLKKNSYIIEKVLSHEPKSPINADELTFLIKWKGYGHEDNTTESWASNESLRTNQVVLKYMNSHNLDHYIPSNIDYLHHSLSDNEDEDDDNGQKLNNCQQTPKIIIIIPYRNRAAQLEILQSLYTQNDDLKVLVIEQVNSLPFNKGALINIGLKMIKELFFNSWKDISLVLHDVDYYPSHVKSNIKDAYTTTRGVVKHIYGFKHSLGGIVVINAYDLNEINGMANLWGWCNEDFILQDTCHHYNLTIDRNTKYYVNAEEGSNQVVNLSYKPDGFTYYRYYLCNEFEREKNSKRMLVQPDGLNQINQLEYKWNLNSNTEISWLHVTKFESKCKPDISEENIWIYSDRQLHLNHKKGQSNDKYYCHYSQVSLIKLDYPPFDVPFIIAKKYLED